MTCWHPIIPAFSARLIIAFRTLLGIICVAAITLSSLTAELHGKLLLGVGFIVCIKTTLGATIQSASRVILGGLIAICYSLPIILYCPKDIVISIAATTVLVLIIVYTDLPVTVRRFTIVPGCIIILQWYNKEKNVDIIYAFQVLSTLTTGSVLAIFVTCIPLPLIPTAHRELQMRMRFIAQQTRRELTAILLLISEYHNEHFVQRQESETKPKPSDELDNGIEMPSNIYTEDDIFKRSSSFEDLKDDHLLKSDIQDLNSLINDELKHMQRALGEISYEPYFICLKIINSFRNCFSKIPILKKSIRPISTLQSRLTVWSTALTSLQRTITGMLSLEGHHHAFVGQRRLINAICILLESTFNFLDSTLPYTTASKNYFDKSHVIAYRARVEEALEDFFEAYCHSRETSHFSSISNTDAIRLNTFLLLILRLVHVTITAAETSETPGAHLDDNQPNQKKKTKKSFDWKAPFQSLATYIGLRPTQDKFFRALKTSLSVLVSATVVYELRNRLQAYGWVYWAPMTTALVSDSSEGSTLRISFHRLMAVLLGSTYAYVVILVTQNYIAVGTCICVFVSLMGYLKTDPKKEYFASVCAQSASIITFLSHKDGILNASNKAVLARTSLTFLGIFIHVAISNLILPITARALIKQRVSIMIKNTSNSLKSACDDFCSFIGTSNETKSSFNLLKTLGDTERIADTFPSLVEEALNEPNFWKRPFIQVKDRYDDLSKSLRRISADIRFIHRCTTILKAESKLHFAQQAKWLVRRTSLAQIANNTDLRAVRTLTMNELRQEQQLQNDLDIPLTIFMTYSSDASPIFEQKTLISNNSSASLRLAHMTLYQPVIEHIRTLEKHILDVLNLTGQLIEKKATVDIGSLELRHICQEDSIILEQNSTKSIQRGPSFYAVPPFQSIPLVTNHYTFLSCCKPSIHEDRKPLPSLRQAVDLMFQSLIKFLYANNRFIRMEAVANQSIGDVLAFHTLSYALKDLVESTTNLAKNARRIKHIDTRTLTRKAREEKLPANQII